MVKQIFLVSMLILSMGLSEEIFTVYLNHYLEDLFIPDTYNANSVGMGNTHILINGNFLANPALTSKTLEFSTTFKVKYGSQDIRYMDYYPFSYEGIYERQYDLHSFSLSNSIPLKNKSVKVGYGFGFNTLYDWSVKSKEKSQHPGGVQVKSKSISEGGVQLLNATLSLEVLKRIVFGIGYNTAFWFDHSYWWKTEAGNIVESRNRTVDYSAQLIHYGLYIRLPKNINIAVVYYPSFIWEMTEIKSVYQRSNRDPLFTHVKDTGYQFPEIVSFGVNIRTIPNLTINLTQTILPYTEIEMINSSYYKKNSLLHDGDMLSIGFEYNWKGIKIRGGKYNQDLIIPQDDEIYENVYTPYGYTAGLGYSVKSLTFDIGYDKNYWHVIKNRNPFRHEEATHSKIVLTLKYEL